MMLAALSPQHGIEWDKNPKNERRKEKFPMAAKKSAAQPVSAEMDHCLTAYHVSQDQVITMPQEQVELLPLRDTEVLG